MTPRNQVLEFSYEHSLPLSSVDLNSSFIWQNVWTVIDHEAEVVRYVSLTAGDNYSVSQWCTMYVLLLLNIDYVCESPNFVVYVLMTAMWLYCVLWTVCVVGCMCCWLYVLLAVSVVGCICCCFCFCCWVRHYTFLLQHHLLFLPPDSEFLWLRSLLVHGRDGWVCITGSVGLRSQIQHHGYKYPLSLVFIFF